MSARKTMVLVVSLVLSLAIAACGMERVAVKYLAPQPPSYPIDSTVVTTLDWTVLPVSVPSTAPKLFPFELFKYS